MGGIIQGFLGGAANAMGEAGKMAFANQLTKERDEANFLRDSELAKTLKREDITSREKISANDLAGRERIAESRDKTLLEAANVRAAATKAASGANQPTTDMKNIRFLTSEQGGGHTLQEAIVRTMGEATITHTDQEGNIVVVERDKDAPGGVKPIFTIRMNDRGLPEMVEEGGQISRTRLTKDERQIVSDIINKEQDNNYAWTKVGPNDKTVKQRGSQMLQEGWTFKDGTAVPPAGGGSGSAAAGLVNQQTQGKTKKVGTRQMTKQQFIEAMVGRYGQDKLADIEATWESIK